MHIAHSQTEPLVGFQPVVVHTMHTPIRMLLQGQFKDVSSHRLARWLTDIEAQELTTEDNRILPHLLGDVEGQLHICEPRPETQSPVRDCEIPGQTRALMAQGSGRRAGFIQGVRSGSLKGKIANGCCSNYRLEYLHRKPNLSRC